MFHALFIMGKKSLKFLYYFWLLKVKIVVIVYSFFFIYNLTLSKRDFWTFIYLYSPFGLEINVVMVDHFADCVNALYKATVFFSVFFSFLAVFS